MKRYIRASHKGAVVLIKISPSDYDKLIGYKWCLNGMGRVVTGRGGKTIYMHRLIMNPSRNQWVDHIDGNPLNNHRFNLRLCTKHQNWYNRKLNRDNLSGYKGVYQNKKTGRYQAAITFRQIKKSLGTFASAEEAAKAYNNAARRYFGEFANLNKTSS